VFVAGGATTRFLEQHLSDLARPEPDARMWACAAALWCTLGQSQSHTGHLSWRSSGKASFPLELASGDIRARLSVEMHPGGEASVGFAAPIKGATILLPANPLAVHIVQRDGPVTRVRIGDVQESVHTTFAEGRLHLELRGVTREFHEPPPRGAEPDVESGRGGDGKLYAPTSGRVVAVHVAPRDRVRPGQILVVLEAMKIENALAVGVSGTVVEVKVVAGDQVPQGRLLVVIDPDDSPDADGAKAALAG
jgi:geranyl-CoA carboxylase alpha subunit